MHKHICLNLWTFFLNPTGTWLHLKVSRSIRAVLLLRWCLVIFKSMNMAPKRFLQLPQNCHLTTFTDHIVSVWTTKLQMSGLSEAAAHLLVFSMSSLLEKLWPLPQKIWHMPERKSTECITLELLVHVQYHSSTQSCLGLMILILLWSWMFLAQRTSLITLLTWNSISYGRENHRRANKTLKWRRMAVQLNQADLKGRSFIIIVHIIFILCFLNVIQVVMIQCRGKKQQLNLLKH